MNALAQWGPAIFMVISIRVGLIYNNEGLDDFKDLLKSEISGSEARLRELIAAGESRIRADLAKLDARVSRLEDQRLVRP